jgi:succinyl-CoA synthetase alpha subunit
MSILISKKTRVLVQGITGREGSYHTAIMQEYGTNIVAGTAPGKGGQMYNGVPVFNTVEAAAKEGVDASVVFVPAKYALDAVYEAAEAGIELIVCITEGIPVNDVMMALRRIRELYPHTRIIGPNCPGIISPGKSSLGIMPGHVFNPGNVGVVSRSGTLTYQIAFNMGEENLGQSTVIGIGGDPFIGSNFIDIIKLFEEDPETEGICIIGEIGGSDEEEAAAYIKENISKPVVAYIAGQTAPPGKKMGHAGAIVSASSGTAATKIKAFQEAGVKVARAPYEVPALLREALAK